jgi:hypothetical protein
MISTAVGITLIAVGAILRFAVPATFTYGLNAHVVSVIVMLAGIFGLLLSLLVWAPLDRRRNHYGDFGRRVPPPAMECLPGPVASAGLVEAVTGSPCCGRASTGRRTVSYHDTWPMGSDQSLPVFHPAGC